MLGKVIEAPEVVKTSFGPSTESAEASEVQEQTSGRAQGPGVGEADAMLDGQDAQGLRRVELCWSRISVSLVMACVGVILYVADIGSDLALVIKYTTSGEYLYSLVTLLILITSSMFVGLFTARNMRLNIKNPWLRWVMYLLLRISNMTPLMWDVRRIRLMWREEAADRQVEIEDAVKEAASARLAEVNTECFPQMMLQLSILLWSIQKHGFVWNTEFTFQLASLSTSTLGIFFAKVKYSHHVDGKPWSTAIPIGILLFIWIWARVVLWVVTSFRHHIILATLYMMYCLWCKRNEVYEEFRKVVGDTVSIFFLLFYNRHPIVGAILVTGDSVLYIVLELRSSSDVTVVIGTIAAALVCIACMILTVYFDICDRWCARCVVCSGDRTDGRNIS